MVSDLDITEVNRRIAEYVGEGGFEPSKTCPQGHSNVDPETGSFYSAIHRLCLDCVNEYVAEPLRRYWEPESYQEHRRREAEVDLHEHDESWHPEWRIGRGEPKPYAESLDLLMPVVEKWAREQQVKGREVEVYVRFIADADEWHTEIYCAGEFLLESGTTPSSVLARAFVVSAEKWG